MSYQDIVGVLMETLNLKKRIDVIKEEQIKDLETQMQGNVEKIKREMRVSGSKIVDCVLGHAKWVDRETKGALDLEAIMKDLGVDTLNKYQKPGKMSSYIKLHLFKEEKENKQ